MLGAPPVPPHFILQPPRMLTAIIIICTFHRGKLRFTGILELAKCPKRHRSKARAPRPFGMTTPWLPLFSPRLCRPRHSFEYSRRPELLMAPRAGAPKLQCGPESLRKLVKIQMAGPHPKEFCICTSEVGPPYFFIFHTNSGNTEADSPDSWLRQNHCPMAAPEL